MHKSYVSHPIILKPNLPREKKAKRTDGAFSFGARKRTRKGVFSIRSSYERHEPLPGRPVKPARLCAWRTGKSRSQTRKRMNSFSGLASCFSYARKLACFPPSHKCILFGFFTQSIRLLESRGRRPLAQVWGRGAPSVPFLCLLFSLLIWIIK